MSKLINFIPPFCINIEIYERKENDNMDTITRGILLNQTFLVEDEDSAKSIQTCIPSMISLK